MEQEQKRMPVPFPKSIFLEKNKKLPSRLLGSLKNHEKGKLLRCSVTLAYFLPVYKVPERRDVIWTSVLVV